MMPRTDNASDKYDPMQSSPAAAETRRVCVPRFAKRYVAAIALGTVTVASLGSSPAHEISWSSQEIVLAQSETSPAVDEINREIEALAASGQTMPKRVPEDMLRRWLPSDDLDDNAATLRSLGFHVEVTDVERDDHPLSQIERRQGTKWTLKAQKILKSILVNGHVVEGPAPGAVAVLLVAVGISIKQDGRRMIGGHVGVDSP
jgi:hypothetical protein